MKHNLLSVMSEPTKSRTTHVSNSDGRKDQREPAKQFPTAKAKTIGQA